MDNNGKEQYMPERRSVLMLVENAPVPGDPRVWHEALALRQCGFQVSIICPKDKKRHAAYTCIEGIHIYRYDLPTAVHHSGGYIKEYLVAMLKTLRLSITVWRKHGFDVIHAANPPDTFFAIGLLYRLIGKKFVFDQHDLTPEVFHVRFQDRMKPLYKLLQFFERCSYQTANLVITTNESQKRVAIKRGHCKPDKVIVVRNGPDIDRFKVHQLKPELKQGKTFLLTYIGVMGVQDGVDYALHALSKLVHEYGHRDILLDLIGDGDQLLMLKKLARELALDEYVYFTGWLTEEELLDYLAVTDVCITPDPSNELNDCSTMIKTIEYMAMGKPTVAFDSPETRYTAQDAALYATPNDVGDFADKIETLLRNADMREQIGIVGRKRVEELLCWDRCKLHLWAVYQKLFPDAIQLPQKQALDGERTRTTAIRG